MGAATAHRVSSIAARPNPDTHDIEQARAGDHAAFERLYRSRVGAISRYVGAMVRDPARTEDVVAQTFLLAWRDLGKLRELDRFDSWLARIAHNQAMNELTRSRKTAPLEELPELADQGRFGRPDRELDQALDAEQLREALQRLPEMQRQALVLRYFHELPSAEIARQLGKNEQSVWALTYRGLQNMKRLLAEPELA